MHRTTSLVTGLAAAAASVALAAPAAAIGPSGTPTDINNVRIACTGDTVSGTAKVVADAPVPVLAVLSVRHADRTFVRTDRFVTFQAVPGTMNYSFSLNAAGLPLTVTDYKVDLTAGTGEATSNAAPIQRCAPAPVVPEVPVAALLPLSLAATGFAVVGLRRRQQADAP